MKKANTTNKALILFTIVFMLIAAFSFAAFQKTEQVCSEAKKCSQTTPTNNSGEMIWDVFSRRLISLVYIR